MPVVTVAAADHIAIGALLVDVADATAHALGLDEHDVIATHVRTGASARSGDAQAQPESVWPIVTIHGSDRGREKMDGAREAAADALRAWCERNDVACEGVWTQWLMPTPR